MGFGLGGAPLTGEASACRRWGASGAWTPFSLALFLALSCASAETRARAHMEAAGEHYRNGSWAAALHEYQEAIRADPLNVRAHNSLAGIYYSLGDRESAVREYEAAIRLDPRFLLPKSSLANIRFEVGEYAEAEILLEDLSYRVKEEAVFIRLGQAAGLQGKHEAAIAHLQRGASFFSGSVQIAKELALETEKVDRGAAVIAWDRVARLAFPFPTEYRLVAEALSAAFGSLPDLTPETMASILEAAREAARTGKAKLEGLPASIETSPVGVTFFRPGERPASGYGEGGSFAENLAEAALKAAGALGDEGPEPVVLIDILHGAWIPMALDWDLRVLADRPVVFDVRAREPFGLGAFAILLEWEDRSATSLPSEVAANGWESLRDVHRHYRGVLGMPSGEERSLRAFRSYAVSFAGSGPGGAPVRLHRMNLLDLPLDPDTLETAYRGGADYLAASVKEDGSFVYLYDAARDRVEEGYNLARHAGATLALLELAEETGEERYREAGRKALEYLLSTVREIPGRGGSAVEGGRIGPTALTLLAAIEEGAEERVLRGMGKFLVGTQRQSGKFETVHPLDGGPRRSRWGPGQAVLALTRLHRRLGDEKYLEAARRGADYIVDQRESAEGFVPDHWFVQAAEELEPIVREPRYARHAYRIAEKLASSIGRPGKTPYPDWVGGFSSGGQEPMGAASLGSLEAILSAYRLSVMRGEPREDLREAGEHGARFTLRLQYRDENTFHLPSPARAKGGFRQGLGSSRIRIDGVQHAALVLLRFRSILLEEEKRP